MGFPLRGLPEVEAAPTTEEYYRKLMEIVARLRDGHSNVIPPRELNAAFFAAPLVRTALVEDRVLVLEVWDDSLSREGLRPGLEIVAVDGLPVREYADRFVRPYQSASTEQDARVRTYDYRLLSGPLDRPVTLLLRDGAGDTLRRTLPRVSWEDRRERVPRPKAMEWSMREGGIAHVRLNSFDRPDAAEEFEKDFEEIAQARAIILDIRENGGGSSGVGYRILSCLIDKPAAGSRWRTRQYRPAFRAWGLLEGFYAGEPSSITPSRERHYGGPVVLLTSPRTFSAAEDFAVAFDAAERGRIIGEKTGGSTGQPLSFDLPGGGSARVCTKRDAYPDGREFVGRGVIPDVLVSPTIADVRAGRDTVLEAALAMLRGEGR